MEKWDAKEPLTAALEYRQGKGTERTRISVVVRSGQLDLLANRYVAQKTSKRANI